MNWIAKSEIPNAIAHVPGAGAKECTKSDPCICFDGIDWDTAQMVKEKLSNDPAKVAAKVIAASSAKAAVDSDLQTMKTLATKTSDLSPEEIQTLLKAIAKRLAP